MKFSLPAARRRWPAPKRRRRRGQKRIDRVGKGALAPCPTSFRDRRLERWARFALPSLRVWPQPTHHQMLSFAFEAERESEARGRHVSIHSIDGGSVPDSANSWAAVRPRSKG